MKTLAKAIGSVALVVAAVASMPANAVLVTFGGQNANVVGGDQSGLTSVHVPVTNIVNPVTGYFIETFDAATANPLLNGGLPGTTAPAPTTNISIAQGQGCSINSFGSVNITASGGGFSVRDGGVSWAANPANDNTCFGFGPQQGSTLPASVKVDYTGFLSAPQFAGAKINYLGVWAAEEGNSRC